MLLLYIKMAYMFLVPLCIDPLCKATSSAQGVYSLVSNISCCTTCPDIINALKRLDIEFQVRILEKFIAELDIKNMSSSLEESLNSLRECIKSIENELCLVHDRISYNKRLFKLNFFGGYKFTKSIANLETLKIQLDNRTKLFFQILNNSTYTTRKNDLITSLILS